jgi:hypothetical protein
MFKSTLFVVTCFVFACSTIGAERRKHVEVGQYGEERKRPCLQLIVDLREKQDTREEKRRRTQRVAPDASLRPSCPTALSVFRISCPMARRVFDLSSDTLFALDVHLLPTQTVRLHRPLTVERLPPTSTRLTRFATLSKSLPAVFNTCPKRIYEIPILELLWAEALRCIDMIAPEGIQPRVISLPDDFLNLLARARFMQACYWGALDSLHIDEPKHPDRILCEEACHSTLVKLNGLKLTIQTQYLDPYIFNCPIPLPLQHPQELEQLVSVLEEISERALTFDITQAFESPTAAERRINGMRTSHEIVAPRVINTLLQDTSYREWMGLKRRGTQDTLDVDQEIKKEEKPPLEE